MTLEEMRKWFTDYIKEFRLEYGKLTEEERKNISNTNNFCAPCQIEVFWMEGPIEHQIIVMTHDSEREDMEIIINGPYEGSDFLGKVSEIMEEPRWSKETSNGIYGSGDDIPKCSDIFAGMLYNIVNSIRNSLFSNFKEGYLSGQIFEHNGWCQSFRGNIANLDYTELVGKHIKEAKNRTIDIKSGKTGKTSQNKNKDKEDILKGHGTFFYPPFWIGEIPEKTFLDKALGNSYTLPKKAFDTVMGEKRVIVNSNGFIGLEGESKEEIMGMLNVIFGLCLLNEVRCFVVRKSEIAEIDIVEEPLTIKGMRSNMNSLRTIQMDWTNKSPIFRTRNNISEEELEKIIKTSEKIYQDEDISQKLIFLLEGYTHHFTSEHSQSFIMNWIIIEKHLSKLWNEIIEEKKITGKRKRKLRNSIFWVTDDIIETLNLLGKITNEEYKLLLKLKKKRNDFVHKGMKIGREESEKLLNMSFNLLKQEIKGILD